MDQSASGAPREYAGTLPNQTPDLVRVITCGNVDDGKSTLIGRLLYDCDLVPKDQRDVLLNDSKFSQNIGSDGIDFSLLVDGLEAEREQSITIDVAYRFFETSRRKFIVADTPGHEQYVRNMATGASTADAAILLVDARKGVVAQTRRHAYIVALMGVRQFIVVVNKMDAVDFDQRAYDRVQHDFGQWSAQAGVGQLAFIPVSAREGDNVARRSSRTNWYSGPTLVEALELLAPSGSDEAKPFRLPIQWVNRPDQDFRGYSGTVSSGIVRVGDEVALMPSGRTSFVRRIVTMDGDLEVATAQQAVTIALSDDIDAGRGDIIVAASDRPEVADQFAANLIWLGQEALLPGRSYILQAPHRSVGCQVTSLRHKVNVATFEHLAAHTLQVTEIGICHLSIDHPISFEPYARSRELGAFVIIDRLTNDTVACGTFLFALRRAHNLHWQSFEIDKHARATVKHQRACVLWFTGLSASGKSTIANIVERKLFERGFHTYLLDGDNVRHGLNKDLGFTAEDRVENIRRIGELAKLFVDAGLIVLAAFISPFREEREMAKCLVADGEFLEFYVNTPLAICENRDPKGLYKKARAGDLPRFTGIDSPYEPPESPDMILAAGERDAEALAGDVVALLRERGYIR